MPSGSADVVTEPDGPDLVAGGHEGAGDVGERGRASRSGWQSRGNLHAVPAVVEFPDPTGSAMTLPGAAVIDLVTAERCVTAFAASLSRPELVEWMRL